MCSTAAVNVTLLLAFAADRRAALLCAGRAAIGRYLVAPGPQQQTRRTLLQRSIAGTDRRTDTVPLHRPCPVAYYASSFN